MPDALLFKIGSPPVHPRGFIRLREGLVHASPPSGNSLSNRRQSQTTLTSFITTTKKNRQDLSQIYKPVSQERTSPTGLSSAEAAALEETFGKAVSTLSSQQQGYPTLDLWLRLYAHALLRESRHIFPGICLWGESPVCLHNWFSGGWTGDDLDGAAVYVKVIREQDWDSLKRIKEIYHRASKEGGRALDHPNVLPIIKVSESLVPLCIMTLWMPDGNIIRYTKMNPDVNRLALLAQVCCGLIHLHGLDIIHGNITPNNILITQGGRACVGEFGIRGGFRGLDFLADETGSLRYMAPEWFSEEFGGQRTNSLTKESDIYSLAMTSFMVLTGVLPYDGSDHHEIFRNIRGGIRPSRPIDPSQSQWLQDPVWDVITASWRHLPKRRSKLPIVYDVYFASSHQEVHNVKTEEPSAPDSETPGIKTGEPSALDSETPGIKTVRQRHGNILPQITSFFQLLLDSESEFQRRVNEMDKRLEDHALSDQERIKLFNKICKTCSRHRIVPESMTIPDCSEGSVEVECGGFAIVSQSTYEGRRVAVKAVHVYITSDLDVIISRFCREGVAWKHLRHPNILPLLGVTVGEHRFSLVSDWMENGNINDFIKRDMQVNRTELLVDIANGLKYMHDLRVVHGDLKGANILINGDRRACIADFGLSTITGVATHAGTSRTSLISNDTLMSFTGGGTRRWMSPELLDPERFGMPESEGNRPTRQSDCYALGMVIYEVLCGYHPYLEIPSDILTVNAIMEGVRPKKPKAAKWLGFTDELWRTVGLCWLEDRSARPCVEDVLSCLSNAVAFWHVRKATGRYAHIL